MIFERQCILIELQIQLLILIAVHERINETVISRGAHLPDFLHKSVGSSRISPFPVRSDVRKTCYQIFVISHNYSPKRSFLVAGRRYSLMSSLNVSSVRLMK